MTHLEFVDKINESGISIISTKTEFGVKRIEIPNSFVSNESVLIDGFNVEYDEKSYSSRKTALQAIITKAIDMDSWKHSWHKEIIPENYEEFIEIIQQKIIDRAKDIDELLTVYFQLQYEINQLKQLQL